MGFQTKINMHQPAGFPGGWGSGNIWAGYAFLAGADITPGVFVTPVPGTNPERVIPGTPGATDVDFLGIATRARIGVITNLLEEHANIINEDFPVEVLTQGDTLIQITNGDVSGLSAGMSVFASLADGTPSVAAAGSTVAGSRETGWKFIKLFDSSYKLALVSTWRAK